MSKRRTKLIETLRKYAFSLPGAYEDHPWGESVAKVSKKVFVFFGHEQGIGGIGFCIKLPQSADQALAYPFAEPAGYGLGKSGWVMVKIDAKDVPPAELFLPWIEESYRAVAPKKLVAQLDTE